MALCPCVGQQVAGCGLERVAGTPAVCVRCLPTDTCTTAIALVGTNGDELVHLQLCVAMQNWKQLNCLQMIMFPIPPNYKYIASTQDSINSLLPIRSS